MKTFRTFGLALIPLFLAVNFTACEDELEKEIVNDFEESESVTDDNEEDTIPHKKRLIEIKTVKNNLDNEPNFKPFTTCYKFSYDNLGRLISSEITNEKDEVVLETYIWFEDSIVCNVKEKNDDCEHILFELDKNLVTTIQREYKSGTKLCSQNFSFMYDSIQHLIKRTFESNIYIYKWKDGKIKDENLENSLDNYHATYTFSEDTCTEYIPIFKFVSLLEYIHPELFGLKINSLLTKEQVYYIGLPIGYTNEYSYTLDSEGYVESYTQNTFAYMGCHDDLTQYSYTTYLKWE